jgi:hypothetical protein
MKTAMLSFAIATVCSTTFLFAPHHRRRQELFRECTLGEIYVNVLGNLPEVLAPRNVVLVLLAFAGIAASLSPMALVLMARWGMPEPERAGGAIFVLGGILGLIGAAANFVAMVVSHMTFGFAASSQSKDQTAFIFVIPAVQISFATASIAIGVSALCASCARRMVA